MRTSAEKTRPPSPRSKKSPREFTSLADGTAVVLAGSLYAGNIGAAARAMRNFGFRRLRLAAPAASPASPDALKMAMESKHILAEAETFDSLEEAVADANITIGTTRRAGRRRGRYFTPPEMAAALAALDRSKRVAIVFGPEDKGLSNDDIALCDWLVTIDTFSGFDSLNLSHAVAVILYEIHRAYHAPAASRELQSKLLDGLAAHVEDFLRATDFLAPSRDPKRIMLTIRRILTRAGMSKNEIGLVHAIIRHVEKEMEREGRD